MNGGYTGSIRRSYLFMENSVVGALLRSRRFGSYVDANSGINSEASPSRKVAVEEQKMLENNELYGEDGGWFAVMISWARNVYHIHMGYDHGGASAMALPED